MEQSLTTIYSNTTIAPTNELASAYGFIFVAISAIGFGTNFLPVKKFDTGDGMFFQWLIANAILIASFITSGILHFPKFEPLVMVGGFLWATGNVCTVPIVKLIGLGLGLLLWSSANLIVGWASARFGWFGIIPQVPNHIPMNYIGFALTAVSPFIYSMVKTNVSQEIIVNIADTLDTEQIITNDRTDEENINTDKFDLSQAVKSASLHRLKMKILAVTLSIFAGTLYGLMFIPLTYVKNHYHGSSQNDVDYILAESSGIYLGSSFYFIVYCIYKRNKPVLYANTILPGLLSGILWFIAYMSYFYANQALSPAISQPIISALPGLIGVIITTIVYKEIRGMRNYLMIAVAIIITTVGVVLTGLSKML